MAQFPIRVSIGSVMVSVVILALFFYGYGVERGSKLAGLFLLLLAPVVFVRSDRRLLVSGWIMALYPILIVLSLYATYLAGWVTLGRAPWASQTPKSLGPIVKQFVQATDLILAGFPASFWTCLMLIGVTIFLLFWFLACQPLFLLLGIYLTWFSAGAILGHQPRIFLDDPKTIRGMGCLVIVTTLWLLTCPFEFVPVYIMMVFRVVNSSRVETHWLARNYPLLVVPLIWGGTLAWLNWDPFCVFEWLVD